MPLSAFHCLSLTYHCLSLLFIAFQCFSLSFIVLSLPSSSGIVERAEMIKLADAIMDYRLELEGESSVAAPLPLSLLVFDAAGSRFSVTAS